MNWFESFLYGLVSGITEFLPISSFSHQQIFLKMFGEDTADPLLNFFVHIALIFAVISGGRNLIDQLRRQQARIHNYSMGNVLELRFLKNSVFPFVVAYLILMYCIRIQINLSWIALFSVLNGVLLFFQSRMMQGSKDERFMSILDSVLIGVTGALSVFPGISRVGVMLTVFTARGVERQKAVSWVILLSIPALIVLAAVDVLNIISNTGSVHFPDNILGYIISVVGAYAAGYLGVLLMKSLSTQKDYSGFAYYSWGIALFSFIMYLTVV